MTLSEFKSVAVNRGNVYDNAKKAGEAWAKSWGLTWWRGLWAYKQYTVGDLTYRTGRVHTRHTSYSVVECFIGDNQVSPSKFSKHLKSLVSPEANTPSHGAESVSSRSAVNKPVQLVLNFDVA